MYGFVEGWGIKPDEYCAFVDLELMFGSRMEDGTAVVEI